MNTSIRLALFALLLASGLVAGCSGTVADEAAADHAVTAVRHSASSPAAQPPAPAAAAVPRAAEAPAGAGSPTPWRMAVQPADVRVAPGEAASFHVRADGGSGAFEYQWLRDGEPIEGATGSQYGFVTTLDDGGASFSVYVRPRGAGPGHERESAPATLAWRGEAD